MPRIETLQTPLSAPPPIGPEKCARRKPFFLTHDDERAPAAAASGEGRKSMQALRSIDLQTRSTDLDVSVCIAAYKTPLPCHNPAVESHHSAVSGGTDRRERNPSQGHSYDGPLRQQHRCYKCPQTGVRRWSASPTRGGLMKCRSVRWCVQCGGGDLR